MKHSDTQTQTCDFGGDFSNWSLVAFLFHFTGITICIKNAEGSYCICPDSGWFYSHDAFYFQSSCHKLHEIFMTVKYSSMCVSHIENSLSVVGYLGCFHILTLVPRATILFKLVCLCWKGTYLEVDYLGQMESPFLLLKKSLCCLHYQMAFLPTIAIIHFSSLSMANTCYSIFLYVILICVKW